MTADSGSWWTSATVPRTPAEARQRVRRAANNPALPEPEPEVSGISDMAALDAVEYARNRDIIMADHGSPRTGEWLGAVEKPQPRQYSAEQMVSMRLGYGAIPTPAPPAERIDPAYQQAQHRAAMDTTLAVNYTEGA